MAGRRRSVEWSEEARRDFLDVINFLRVESPSAAKRFLSLLDRGLRRIRRFPDSGRPIPEDATPPGEEPTRREVLVMTWRVGYQLSSGRITVLYVIHGRRQFPRLR